jgi:hypothetical protein
VFFSDGSSKTLQKTFYKKIVSKSFYKKIDQKSKTDFFSDLFYHVFGRFSMRGVQKHDKTNIEKINLTLVFSRTLTHPLTHHGWSPIFFFLPAPCKNDDCGVHVPQPQKTKTTYYLIPVDALVVCGVWRMS